MTSVGPVSEGAVLSNVIREFTQEKNLTTVKSVGASLDREVLSKYTREFIQKYRSPALVTNVEAGSQIDVV